MKQFLRKISIIFLFASIIYKNINTADQYLQKEIQKLNDAYQSALQSLTSTHVSVFAKDNLLLSKITPDQETKWNTLLTGVFTKS